MWAGQYRITLQWAASGWGRGAGDVAAHVGKYYKTVPHCTASREQSRQNSCLKTLRTADLLWPAQVGAEPTGLLRVLRARARPVPCTPLGGFSSGPPRTPPHALAHTGTSALKQGTARSLPQAVHAHPAYSRGVLRARHVAVRVPGPVLCASGAKRHEHRSRKKKEERDDTPPSRIANTPPPSPRDLRTLPPDSGPISVTDVRADVVRVSKAPAVSAKCKGQEGGGRGERKTGKRRRKADAPSAPHKSHFGSARVAREAVLLHAEQGVEREGLEYKIKISRRRREGGRTQREPQTQSHAPACTTRRWRARGAHGRTLRRSARREVWGQPGRRDGHAAQSGLHTLLERASALLLESTSAANEKDRREDCAPCVPPGVPARAHRVGRLRADEVARGGAAAAARRCHWIPRPLHEYAQERTQPGEPCKHSNP
ncbi:hypothetical protein FB451DRAFT_1432033 [Mycena latifolia]|nr:hypothetical protein FB451DRAFT_1432033 [Mycena latifolia]